MFLICSLRLRLLILTVAFFILSLSGFAKDYGDAIIVASIADARTLVPILASDSASSGVVGMVFNGLVKYDKDINITGDLAKSWEIKEGGLVIIFHLRDNVRWHDGHKFTAEDVEFTYKSLVDPKVRTPYSGDFERIASLKAIDDYTLEVRYKEPFAPALSSWGMPVMPRHLLEGKDLNTGDFKRRPIGTGPYRLKRWKTQEKIELVSNHEYFEGRPYIDRYIYRIIPDEATIFLELEVEGVDMAGLTPLQYRRQTGTPFFKTNYNKFRTPSFSYTYLGYNLTDPKFKDKRVRQALNYAIDKDEIISIALLGLARPTTGPFIPGSWAYNEEVFPAEFSPESAKKLLKDSGWDDTNNDGWLDKDGRMFEFTIVTNQGNEERLKVAQIIQRRLKEVGIKVRIKVVEWSVFLSEFIDKSNFEAVLLGWSLARDPDNYDIWHSSKIKEGEFNFLRFNNSQVDSLLVLARGTFDQEKRKEYYRKIHRIIYEEQPCMFLYVPDNLTIIHKRFREVRPAPLGIGYNFIEWWVPFIEQKHNITYQR